MASEKILVVDDEEDILKLLEYNLTRHGFRVVSASTGEEALREVRTASPDLMVLDLMLPGIDGLEICRILKNDPKLSHIPILMLTARDGEADIVAGLELGADDYITKPFSPRVLAARINALLRRTERGAAPREERIKRGTLVIDPLRHKVLADGEPVDLTYTEFSLLQFLAARPGWVFTRNQIIDAVHGSDYPVTDRSVDVQIVGLRKKLGGCGECIETVRGVGYRFRE